MSYDMTIGAEHFNHTWNVSEMWYAAMPEKGIRCIYGMTGKDALRPLRQIREYMEDNEADLLQFEPDNGWGNFDGALGFINQLIAASLRNPDEVWEGD